jgi:hypothetical protein
MAPMQDQGLARLDEGRTCHRSVVIALIVIGTPALLTIDMRLSSR